MEHVCIMVPKDVDPEVFILWMHCFSCEGTMVTMRVLCSPYTEEVGIECYFTSTGLCQHRLFEHRVLLEHTLVWNRFKQVGDPAMWSCFPCLFPVSHGQFFDLGAH